MTLEHDPRTGSEDSGYVTVASGDGDTPATAYTVPSDALFRPTRVKIEYPSSGATTAVNLWDEDDGTGAGALADQRDAFTNLSSSDEADVFEGPWRVFDNDVVVNTDSSQDADVEVTVYGVLLTDLKDMAGF